MTIPAGVTKIGISAFNGCSLTSVTIPDGVTVIEVAAFENCSSLRSVTIPNSVTTTIGDCAFGNCSSLTTVNYKGTQKQWGQISKNACNEDLTNATINYNYSGE